MIRRTRLSLRRPSGVRVELLEARDVPSGLSVLDGGGIQMSLSEVTLTLVRVSEAVTEESGHSFDLGENWRLFVESPRGDNAWRPDNDWGWDWDWSDEWDADRGDRGDDSHENDRDGWKDKGKAKSDRPEKDQPADTAPPAVGGPTGPSRPASPGQGQAGNRDGGSRTETNSARPARSRGEDGGDNSVSATRSDSSATEGQEAGDSGADAARGEAGMTSDADPTPTTQAAVTVQPTPAPAKNATAVAMDKVVEATPAPGQQATLTSVGDEQFLPAASRSAGEYPDAVEGKSGPEALPALLDTEAAPEEQVLDPVGAGLLEEFAALDAGALDAALNQFLRDLADPEAAEAWLSRLGPWLAAGAAGVGLASELARRHLRHTRRNLLRAVGPDGVSLTWFPELGSSLE
jgi:hypothetical protein